jgi:hypothetical protein
MSNESIPLSIYKVRSYGLHVGYLTIDDSSLWGKLALSDISSSVPQVWIEKLPAETAQKVLSEFIKDKATTAQ